MCNCGNTTTIPRDQESIALDKIVWVGGRPVLPNYPAPRDWIESELAKLQPGAAGVAKEVDDYTALTLEPNPILPTKYRVLSEESAGLGQGIYPAGEYTLFGNGDIVGPQNIRYR
ncbi:hypothetical protein [Larkinella soli]|uniref:hypothetical protein n=1 Tax=Larkinella soli TaxID=1770527 RepID=UPI000FFCB9F4|nr:hypothetical protein [Larkinella soli]